MKFLNKAMVLFLHNPEYYLQCELINGHSLIIIDLVDQVRSMGENNFHFGNMMIFFYQLIKITINIH